MKKKRIFFTGGGSAGHVIVNLALIPVFQNEGWEVDYIGSKQGIEKELIAQLPNVTYYPIATGKLRRYMSLENLKDPFKVLKGVFDAWRIIGKRKPAIVFSKGGFVSVPVVLAAKLRRVPIVIHESDYTPGLANKIAIPFAHKVLTTFPETMSHLPAAKASYVGPIIREELFQGDAEKGFQITSFSKEKPVLLIMGGSAGSQNINTLVRESLPSILQEFQVIHICGKGNVDPSIQETGYIQFEYVNEILKDLFAMTDYVLSRAGSNAIFEFLALKIPMLLIPLPLSASRGDQILNAQSFVKHGYAYSVDEESLTTERLIGELQKLKKYGQSLKDTMRAFNSEKARDDVVEMIKHYAK